METPIWQCLVAVLSAFVFWLWALFFWFKLSKAHQTIHGTGFVKELEDWARVVREEGSVIGRALLVFGGVFLKIGDFAVKAISGTVTASLITSGPVGIAAIGAVCAPQDWIPDAIKELRKLLEGVADLEET